MNKLRFYLVALAALFVFSVRADEGMWLLQLMQQQHSIDMMKKQGLKLEAQDLYNPNAFPNGCAAFQKEPPKDPEQKGPSFRSIFLLCRPSKCFISFFSFYANHLSYFFFARLKNEI